VTVLRAARVRAVAVGAATALAVAVGVVPAVADEAGRDALQRAVEASRATAYEGRVVIVGFDATGAPTLAELEVAHGSDGGMQVGVAERWTIGRNAGVAFRSATSAGGLLALSGIEPLAFSVEDLLGKYDVVRQGASSLATGPATVVGVRERGATTDRERLHIDDRTGLVVRRETFDGAGEPVRLVAFTALDVTDEALVPPAGMRPTGGRALLSATGLDVLGEVGWEVPSELGAGFRLREAYALPENEGGSVHLVYSDGLYTLSVYEQHGRLDPTAVRGARPHAAGDHHVWRWPGSEPERVVWSGAGMTFTAVSDAPLDTITTAIRALPADPPPGVLARVARGLSRLGSMLWPFD
jgi:hypothetical protein